MRSITMCRTTVLAAVAFLPALAVASPAAVPAPAAGDAAIAWVVGDAGFESPRFRRALPIDRLAPSDVAARFASLPEGSRVAYSERLLAGFVGEAGDRVVVSGRITDHHGPWLDAASVRTRLEVEQLAKEFASRGTTIDALLLGGTNPLAAERIDTDDDLVWMAIRNDARFATIASDDLSLAGAMNPTNPQWKAWNEFADVTIAKAISESVAAPLRELNGSLSIAAPIAVGIGRRELGATPVALRMHGTFGENGAGGAASAFEVLADGLDVAVKASRGGRMLQPWVRPYSHAGTRGDRSAVAGTLLWDELVRHAVVLGGGRVVYVEDRSLDLAAADASRFAAVLDGVAEELADDSLAYAGEASIRRGQGFVAVGMPIGSGEVLWRISFAPGIGGIDIEIDGSGLRVERRRGESGAWLRAAADSRLEFFDRAFARRDATTGGGLVAAPTTKGSTKVGPLLSAGPEGVALGDSGVGDLNGDGIVDGADLAIHLANGPDAPWGGGITDLNGDGVIDGADMAIHLSGGPESNWNGAGWDDLNGDGIVDGADLAIDLAGGRAGDWNGAGWNDLNGDGVSDGADLAITLAGGGSSSAVPGDLNGDGVVDGADLAIDLAGRIRVRKPAPDVAGRPTIVDGGVSTVDDPASGGGSETPNGGTGSSGGAPPTVDPTTPVTPPSPPPSSPAPSPRILTNELPLPSLLGQFEAAGGTMFRCIYQHVVDPGATGGLIDADAVVAALSQTIPATSTEYVMLDFEHPFCDVLGAHRTYPNGEPHPQYEQTVSTMLNLLTRLRSAFPGVKWTYYGIPYLRYWPMNTNGVVRHWANIDESSRESQYQRMKEVYGPLVQAVDWISPTVYDIYDSGMYTAEQRPLVNARETAWRSAVAEHCKRLREEFGLGDIPIIPTVNYTYPHVGTIEFTGKLIPISDFLHDQVQPLIEAGVDGIALWHSSTWQTSVATNSTGGIAQQEVLRTALARNYLGATDPSTAQQAIVELGFEGWSDQGLRQYLLSRQGEIVLERISAISSALGSAGE